MKKEILYNSLKNISNEIMELEELYDDLYNTMKKTILLNDEVYGNETLVTIKEENTKILNELTTIILPNIKNDL